MKRVLHSLFICSKPGLSSLVIVTYLLGAVLAIPPTAWRGLTAFVLALAGLVLLVGGANVWNCYLERDVDPYMTRTKLRPMVTGVMKAWEGLVGALVMCAIGLALIYIFSNRITFLLGCLSLFTYVACYTPLKRKSSLSLFVGAIPGALPPVMGWTALRSDFGLTAHILFWIMFLWQLPHFISIAIYRRDEYALAGLKTLPYQVGVHPAKWHMFLYSLLLVSVSFLPYFFKLAGAVYMSAALLVGISFLWFCWESLLEVDGMRATRKVFFASLIYLPATMGVWAIEALLRSAS